MDTWLRLLVTVLTAMLCFPFLLTCFLYSSARFESEKALVRKRRIPALMLNLLGNGLVLYGAGRKIFHTPEPWSVIGKLLRLQGSWGQLSGLAILVLLCGTGALVIGFLLRSLLLWDNRSPVSGRPRLILLLLCALLGGVVLITCGIANRENRHLMLTGICRKTNVYVIDPNKEEGLGDGGREISYVLLRNGSPLDCEIDTLYLSDTEEDLTALSFQNVSIPAGETVRLTMDYEHGLDLRKDGETIVYLSLNERTVLDRVVVPALSEHEEWHLSDTGIREKRAYRSVLPRTLDAPTFSRESGFYEEGFELTLSGPEDTRIRYTLDGSDPTESGLIYMEPLRIEDPTPRENVWSSRTDVSAAFLTDNPRFTVPDEPVDKCAVVRAVCENDTGEMSPVVTSVYFIGYDRRKGYANLGVVSIVTDPANLFSDETGIYVLGDVYAEKHAADSEAFGWGWWSANYHQKGRGWEREAAVQFFGPERNLQLSAQLGIRIKGGASAGLLPKGLNLYAREDYSGQSVFGVDFFGDGYGFEAKRLSLSAGGNDVDLKIRDWLTSRLLEGTDIRTVRNRFLPYCVFLNGEYWGNYWLIEQYDAAYFAFYSGLSEENAVVIKNGSVNAGRTEDIELFYELSSFAVCNDLSEPETYEAFVGMADPGDFVAYYALEMYIANQDRALSKNSALWRARSPEDVPAGDTRWRWALFDVNGLSCYGNASSDTMSYMLEKDIVFASLMQNADFRKAFYDMLKKYATEVFTPERAEEALKEFTVLMEAPMNLEHQRFNRSLKGLEGLEKIRTFIRDRQMYILDLCAAQTEE